MPKVSEKGLNIFNITVTLHESCVLKSARSSVIMRNISELGNIIDTKPTIENIENERFDREFSIIVSTERDAEKLEESVKRVSEISKVEVKPLDTHNNTQVKKESKRRNLNLRIQELQ